ncbi:MAG: 30S ribosomal protein S20 [Bdellovibrionales bacterium]|nr:30S ribosomal protein S20 [Bdellovibrionales bacterium]
MANHKSAAKRARQSLKIQARKGQAKSTVRTFEKKLRKAVETKDSKLAQELLVAYSSKMGKAAQKGIFHANNAARKISRLSKLVFSTSK